MVNAAIVGFGQIAESAHAPALVQKGVRVVAIAEPNAERQAAARKIFPEATLYPGLDALLDSGKKIDFVDIATLPFLHAKQALAVLKRGIPVLCEKPLALSTAELAALVAARQNKVLWTVHNWAYAPQWIKIREILSDWNFGSARRVDIDVRRTAPAGLAQDVWRRDPKKAGGGILVDHGWHNLYLIYQALGIGATEGLPEIRIEKISGKLGAEDEIVLLLSFAAGRQARLSLSWKAQERANDMRLERERGALELNDDVLKVYGMRQETIRFPEKLSQSSSHPAWFSAMLGDFLAALSSPQLAQANLEQAEFCCKTIAAVYSAQTEALVP